MLLYFKKLGATATVLSLVAAATYVFNVLQIPAANYVERVGYRTFVLRGWSTRTFFVLLMACVAMIPNWMDAATRMCLMLALIFCYQTSRGISVCGFLPWITQLVPEKVRGRYISLDQTFINGTNVVLMIALASYFCYFGEHRHFAPLFLAAFLSACVSLFFLKRTPDAPLPPSAASRQPVPWGAIFRHPPFQRLLIYDFIVHSAISAGLVFYIPFLKDVHGASDSLILTLGVISSVVGIICLVFFGKLLDRVGNRPFLSVSNLMLGAHFLGWCLVAAKILPLNWWTIIFLQVTTGFGVSFFNMANTRLAMSIVPAMGRSHFFALFSVCINLTMGLVPILWGLAIDVLAPWQWQWGFWNWNIYTLLYAVLGLTIAGAWMALGELKDAPSMSTEEFIEELFIKTPARAISRLWKRRPVHSPQI